jgi:hypothetical protein
MEYAFFWIAFSVVVGVAANARGRDGVGWFLLALFISPLIALLLVLVMQRRGAQTPFEPDAVHAGIPYRMAPDGAVEAVIQGAQVRFSDLAKFSAATGGPPPALPTKPNRPALNVDRSPWAWFIFLLVIAFFVVLMAKSP